MKISALSCDVAVHCAHTELVDVTSLVRHPRNPNRHPPEQIRMLAKIIKHQGWRNPIVVSQRSGFMIKGHGRLDAALLNGWSVVPIDRQAYATEADEWADMVADNHIAELAEPDIAMTLSLIDDLVDFDAELMGFDADALDGLRVDVESLVPVEVNEDEIPAPPEVPITKRGDLWIMGRHRLLCGDSTTSDVDVLMGKTKADLLLTDPPYGVSYADKNAFLNTIAPGNRIQERILNDHKTAEEMRAFWDVVLVNAHHATTDRASYYVFSPQGGDLMMMMMMSIRHAKWQLKHMLVWVKNNHVLGRCDYNYKHEPVFYGWKDNGTHDFYGDGSCVSVLSFDKPLKNDLHPTMKPVELCQHLVGNSTRKGGAVLDLFGGSGTTLVACEASGRSCFMMEMDEKYCDVIVARWEKLTGGKATRSA